MGFLSSLKSMLEFGCGGTWHIMVNGYTFRGSNSDLFMFASLLRQLFRSKFFSLGFDCSGKNFVTNFFALLYCISLIIRWSFTFENSPKNLDQGLFRKGKTRFIDKFYRTD